MSMTRDAQGHIAFLGRTGSIWLANEPRTHCRAAQVAQAVRQRLGGQVGDRGHRPDRRDVPLDRSRCDVEPGEMSPYKGRASCSTWVSTPRVRPRDCRAAARFRHRRRRRHLVTAPNAVDRHVQRRARRSRQRVPDGHFGREVEVHPAKLVTGAKRETLTDLPKPGLESVLGVNQLGIAGRFVWAIGPGADGALNLHAPLGTPFQGAVALPDERDSSTSARPRELRAAPPLSERLDAAVPASPTARRGRWRPAHRAT